MAQSNSSEYELYVQYFGIARAGQQEIGRGAYMPGGNLVSLSQQIAISLGIQDGKHAGAMLSKSKFEATLKALLG